MKGLPLEERLASVEDVLAKVAADASVINRDFLPEEVVAAVAIIAAAATESRDYVWMNDENFLDAIQGIRRQGQLHNVALAALSEVADGDDAFLLAGWKDDGDRAAVVRQVDEIRAVLSGV
ncbi:hypothetical protein [Streptomyces hokutonensis]|uniref:hypothetical protein n=1 Tax=Streptomyces hokutonensis TaxID=1306990 RepID=UPI001FDEC577|nr:hypothetical protein [Streptomyces hokutonensis]